MLRCRGNIHLKHCREHASQSFLLARINFFALINNPHVITSTLALRHSAANLQHFQLKFSLASEYGRISKDTHKLLGAVRSFRFYLIQNDEKQFQRTNSC
jgi:hypothetical protein